MFNSLFDVLYKATLIFSPILIIANYLFGIIGGIWLLCLGQWKFVLILFIISMMISTIYSFTIFPVNTILSLPTLFFANKNKKTLAVITAILPLAFHGLFDFFYITLTFNYFTTIASNLNLIVYPFILYGYSVVIQPFLDLANKENNIASITHSFILQISFLILSAMFLLNLQIYAYIIMLLLIGFNILLNISMADVSESKENCEVY